MDCSDHLVRGLSRGPNDAQERNKDGGKEDVEELHCADEGQFGKAGEAMRVQWDGVRVPFGMGFYAQMQGVSTYLMTRTNHNLGKTSLNK